MPGMTLGLLVALATAAQAPTVEPSGGEEARCIREFREAWESAVRASGVSGRGTDSKEDVRKVLALLQAPKVCLELPETRAALARGPGRVGALRQAVAKSSSSLARSLDAAATNPSGVDVLERGGLIDKIALLLGSSNLVSSNDTAVTLSLNFAGLLGQGPESEWTRLGGSFTFGAKVPESEIIGFSGFPSFDTLFDVFVWDVKVRLLGNRDPLGREWREERAALGALGWMDTLVLRGVPTGGQPERELANVAAALAEEGIQRLTATRQQITTSWLVSAKFSGQHLTEQEGMDKYAGSLFVDKGFAGVGLAFNATYSSVQGLVQGAATPYSLRTWKLSAGLTGSLLADVIVEGRSAEYTLAGDWSLPMDGDDVPLDRKSLWKVSLALKLPVSKTAMVPVSVTYTNDPNALTNQKFVKGRIGIQYDFGGLKRLAGE